MVARIYQPSKTAMQSGQAKTREWVLVFTPAKARVYDRTTGWVGAEETRSQIRLTFPTLEAAQAYAQEQGIAYQVETTQKRALISKSYADNFRHDRPEAWTH